MSAFLPFALPLIEEDEIAAVCNVMRSGWLTTGPKTKQFEKDFASFIGARHAVAVNSATAGLHLALEAAGIKAGDKVITSVYTFTATAEVIRYFDAEPVLVDINPDTFNLNIRLIEEYLGQAPGIKAVIPVHFGGQACDMKELLTYCKAAKVTVIEDAAHALPATYNRQMIGTIGDFTVFSFYVTKTIATGEGGMVTTNNPAYAKRIKTMRLHGISRDVFDRYRSKRPSWYYEVVAPGYKYNLTDIAAAIGIEQLKKAIRFQKRRQAIAETYNEAFKNLPLKTPFIARSSDIHAWHLYVIQLELEQIKLTRDRFIELMAEAGIGTSVHFIPLHLHPYWKKKYGYKPEDFPVALNVFKRAVSLPIYPKMTDHDVERVIKTVTSILERFSR